MTFRRWGEAMERALYGPEGFYRRELPRDHFATSAQSPVFAEAVARLVEEVDASLGGPEVFEVVDVGAGGGELLERLASLLDDRFRLTGVELRPRPRGLPERMAWRSDPPTGVTGLLIACELLDNVPCDVAVVDEAGRVRYEEGDEAGATRPGTPVGDADAKWLAEWWPVRQPGERAEIGLPREARWRELEGCVAAGTVLAVDYGHTRADRPETGSIVGFRDGGGVWPVPDGACDITADVAVDAIGCGRLQSQREALLELGLPVERPSLEWAYRDPIAYAMELERASASALLTHRAGFGAHWWMRTEKPRVLAVE